MNYKTIIGLEIHLQLKTETKVFCGCPTSASGEALPNSLVCPICLGMPGTLPMLNRKAVDFGILIALTVGAEINKQSNFYRKNYFYPDLPKGYQITQHAISLARGGFVEIETSSGKKRIGLIKMHLEEDAGKTVHNTFRDISLVDFNRCGVPLLEIVSKPDMNSPEEAVAYVAKIKQISEYLGICEGRMEEGNLRVDANVNIELPGGTRTPRSEIKNLNSFRFMAKALQFEVERHIEAIEKNRKLTVETRLFDERTGETKIMRTKEEESDYRYFPEPDLPVLFISNETIERLRNSLPELPENRIMRFMEKYRISKNESIILCSERQLADYFETVCAERADPKRTASWLLTEIFAYMKDNNLTIKNVIDIFPPKRFAELLSLIDDGTISNTAAKDVFREMFSSGENAQRTIERLGLSQLSDDSELEKIVEKIISAYPQEVARYREGKTQLLGFFVGLVMKESKGKANPKKVNELIIKRLEN